MDYRNENFAMRLFNVLLVAFVIVLALSVVYGGNR